MLEQSLAGLRVLVASDHFELGLLFATIVAVGGGLVDRAFSADETLTAIARRPHVLVVDVAMPGGLDLVPLGAEQAKVPVVAFLFRHDDPAGAAALLRASKARLLPSTDLFQVCTTLRRAVAEAA
jgi:DNA-binding response OmpR family regulator